jgi:hypothetical protein
MTQQQQQAEIEPKRRRIVIVDRDSILACLSHGPCTIEEIAGAHRVQIKRAAPIVAQLLRARRIRQLEGRSDDGHAAVYCLPTYAEALDLAVDHSDLTGRRDYRPHYDSGEIE